MESLVLPVGAEPRRLSSRLTSFERVFLAIGIADITLQFDKYLMFRELDAELGAVGGLVVSLTLFSICMLYGAWISSAAVSQTPLRIRWIIGAPMLVYLATVAISVVSAESVTLWMFDLFLLVQSFLLFFYVANRLTTKDDLFFCISCLAITVITQSVIIFGLLALGETVHGNRIEIGPLVLLVAADGRLAGSMQSPNVAGSTLFMMWLPCVAVMFVPARSYAKWLCIPAALLGLFAILLTQSRGAVLSAAIGLVILGTCLYLRGDLPRWVLPGAAILSCLLILPTMRLVENRLSQGDNESAGARVHLSSIAMEMIRDRPINGFGAGNCHAAGQRYADQAKYRSLWYYTVHCKYLLVWIETGLLGLLAFLTVLFVAVRQALRGWISRDPVLGPIGIAIAAAIAGHMAHMLVDIFNSRTQVQILWVVFGLAAITWRLSSETIPQHRAPTAVGEFHAA